MSKLDGYPVSSPLRDLETVRNDPGFEFNCPNIKERKEGLIKKLFCAAGHKWFSECQGDWRLCNAYRNKWMQNLSDEERAMYIAEQSIKLHEKLIDARETYQLMCQKCGASFHSEFKDAKFCRGCIDV